MKRSRIARKAQLVRRTPIQKANAAKKAWTKVLDPLCRAVVFARDGGRCQWHHAEAGIVVRVPAADWAHVESRRYWSTRWALENSLALCKGCHLKAHHRPLAFASWFERTFPERAQFLERARRNRGGGKPDLAGTKLYLERELRRYNESGGSPREPRPEGAPCEPGPPDLSSESTRPQSPAPVRKPDGPARKTAQ